MSATKDEDGIALGEPPIFVGSFWWRYTILQKNIAKHKSDYTTKDPSTWPLISSKMTSLKNTDKRLPPAYVAYSLTSMRKCLTDWKNVCKEQQTAPSPHDPTKTMNARFLYYPFNFDENGQIRSSVRISADDYRKWMTLVNGVPPSAPSAPEEEDISVEAAYTKIMDKVVENGFDADDEINKTKESLAKAQDESAKLKSELDKAKTEAIIARADAKKAIDESAIAKFIAAKSKAEATKAKTEATERAALAKKLKKQHEKALAEEKKKTNAAEETIKLHKKILLKRDEELASARKEVAQANKRIVGIWKEMNKSGKKRKTDSI